MRYEVIKLIDAADNSTSQTSTLIVDANQIVNMSFQTVMGDTSAAGTVKVQASNDQPKPGQIRGLFTPTNWSDVTNATSAIVAGVGPLIVLSNLAVGYVRVVFTSSNAGNTTITVQASLVGA